MRMFMISDLHFAINHNVGTRRCSDSPRKLERLREVIASCELRVQLGDLINGSGDTGHDTAALSLISSQLDKYGFWHVLGNHDAFALGKSRFSYYTPGIGCAYMTRQDNVDFIVLDANFTCGGNDYSPTHGVWEESFIPPCELEWLRDRLNESRGAVVFCHQNFDDRPDDPHVIRNADIVRRIFAASGKVRYVFCGHYHAGGDSVIDGIRYHTLPAVCEGSSIPYCIAEINAWDDIVVTDSCIDLGS